MGASRELGVGKGVLIAYGCAGRGRDDPENGAGSLPRAPLPAQPPPPPATAPPLSPWEQPRRPGLLAPRPPRSLLLQGRVGWAEPGSPLLPPPPPGRDRERNQRGSRRRARPPATRSPSRSRPGARGDVSHELDVDVVPRAAAAVDGAPGGRGPGRRAAHGVRLRALPARGVGAADGALRAHPARPLQPHARLVLDRPQGGARTRPIRLRPGLSRDTPGRPSEGSLCLGTPDEGAYGRDRAQDHAPEPSPTGRV